MTLHSSSLILSSVLSVSLLSSSLKSFFPLAVIFFGLIISICFLLIYFLPRFSIPLLKLSFFFFFFHFVAEGFLITVEWDWELWLPMSPLLMPQD